MGPNAKPKGKSLSDLGFYRVAAVSSALRLGEPDLNAKAILENAKKLDKDDVAIAVFPELCLTGYTIDDFHHNDELLGQTRQALASLVSGSKQFDTVLIVGAPYQTPLGKIFNTAFVIGGGKLWGAVPKTHLPNYKEFYEKRWFSSGKNVDENIDDPVLGQFRIGTRQLFRLSDLVFGIEICEDFFAPDKPSVHHTLAGATAVFNLSASNELIAKADWRRDKVRVLSGDLGIAYVYTSAGPSESTKDMIFSGHLLIGENGAILSESRKFSFDADAITADIDVSRLRNERRINHSLSNSLEGEGYVCHVLPGTPRLKALRREFRRTPFVPDHPSEVDLRAEEIFKMLATALARRLRATGSKHMVIGLSGGLDSTLAFLVCLEAAKILRMSSKQILAITMPGFGTTKETKTSARELAEHAGATFEEISIEKAVEQHFKDIGHDPKNENITFENAQARERTQILFDRANADDVKGIVIGTGDMSELWLGWATYNGDHMSGYNVNASVPKTLVRHLVGWYAHHHANDPVRETLDAVLERPISPELKRPDKAGKISQKTEDVVGPYLLHDFFLYHHLRNGFGPRKIFFLACHAFAKDFSAKEIKKWLEVFFKRGYQNQFKRTALPGGPKIGTVGISPRSDLRLPDEMLPSWIFDELKSL